MTSMADEEQSTFSLIPGLVQGYIGQLRATTERLQDLGHLPSAAGIPTPTLPGAFSAAQMATITDSIAAQRRSIEALQAQLSAYDEQLAVLEQALGPLSEWSKTWADFEQQVLKMGQKPGSGRLADAGPVN
jgi:uncharacterized coiled-coil protein SlyX